MGEVEALYALLRFFTLESDMALCMFVLCTESNNSSMCFRKRMVYLCQKNRTVVAIDRYVCTFNKTDTVICNAL